MKIIVHDYAGHPFQADLSRELARRGHEVEHIYFSGDQGPKGNLVLQDDDPVSLSFRPIDIGLPYSKSNFFVRRKGDLAYGRKLYDVISSSNADIVISGNTPTEAQEYVIRSCSNIGAKFYFWIQDFYSIAVEKILSKKMPVLGGVVSWYYKLLERRQLRNSDGIIAITDAFDSQLGAWGIDSSKIHVIPNWGAISEIPCMEKEDSSWAIDNGLGGRDIVLYSGTLGLKHNPGMLLALAKDSPSIQVVVAAAGVGVEMLKRAKEEKSVDNLTVVPLQDFSVFPSMLAAASVLVAFIEDDAGEFSVPSKILSYLCAKRPIVLAAPRENLASKIITENMAGLRVDASDGKGFVSAVMRLISDKGESSCMASSGRAYAERFFNIEKITDDFERAFFADAR